MRNAYWRITMGGDLSCCPREWEREGQRGVEPRMQQHMHYGLGRDNHANADELSQTLQ